MADDIPEADRTVTVEEAHLLRAQVEHSEDEAAEGDDVTQKYHQQRVEFTEERIEQIESEGITESEIEDSKDELVETIENTEPDTDERLEAEAEFDTLRQIHQRYFGGGPDVVEVEAIQLTGYDNGAVEFKDGSGKAIVTFPGEGEARGAADAILDCNGLKEEAAAAGLR